MIENDNGIAILYFSNKVCAACDVIHKKIEVMLKSYPNIKIIDIVGEENLELAAEYNVFSYPLIVVLVNGKETIRVGRNIDFLEFEKNIEGYYNMIF